MKETLLTIVMLIGFQLAAFACTPKQGAMVVRSVLELAELLCDETDTREACLVKCLDHERQQLEEHR